MTFIRSVIPNLQVVRLSSPARKDFVFIGAISTIWLLIILWQGVDNPIAMKFLYSLGICATPIYLMAFLLPSPQPKQNINLSSQKVKSQKKESNSLAMGSLVMSTTLFILSFIFGQSWLMLLSFGVLILGNVYNALKTGRWRKMRVFFKKVYLSNGVSPYLLSLVTVGITFSLTVFLDNSSPAFLHYQWQPFSDFKGSSTMIPISAALKTGWIGLVILTILIILVVLPYMAYEEERLFRYKRISLGQVFRGALIFGPVHVISGIPLYAGAALMVTGLLFSSFYTYHYHQLLLTNPASPKRAAFQALFPVTALHTVHNSLIFIAFFTLYILN